MLWNWAQPDWPKFTWNQSRLALAERQFLVGGGVFVGAVKHLGDEDRNELIVEAVSTEAASVVHIKRKGFSNISCFCANSRRFREQNGNGLFVSAEFRQATDEMYH